jgi:hypothetical protein
VSDRPPAIDVVFHKRDRGLARLFETLSGETVEMQAKNGRGRMFAPRDATSPEDGMTLALRFSKLSAAILNFSYRSRREPANPAKPNGNMNGGLRAARTLK